jgi:hypothetical protein
MIPSCIKNGTKITLRRGYVGNTLTHIGMHHTVRSVQERSAREYFASNH